MKEEIIIAVIMGGNSSEREVSIMSGKAVLQALKNKNIQCFAFDWKGNNLQNLYLHKFDKVFIALHGRGGEDGFIQKELANKNIPYTGSCAESSQNCMDKIITKNICKQHNLPLVKWVVATKNNIPNIDFGLPFAVKPSLEGSSFGISNVKKIDDLQNALDLAHKYDENAIIEEWIDGKEYTVAILNDVALPVVEIVTQGSFYDYAAKYKSQATNYICPAKIENKFSEKLQNLALKVFTIMNCKTWARVDFIVKNDDIFILEINTVPGMTAHSLVPIAAKQNGIDFDNLVVKIING